MISASELRALRYELKRLSRRTPILHQMVLMPDLDTHGHWLELARDEFRVNRDGSLTFYSDLPPDEQEPGE